MPDEREHMSSETRLTKDDIALIKQGLPIIKAVIGFGKVTKWLAITVLGIFAGMVLLGESVAKVIAWLWPPPHP
mgnify:CR=1 FL=1